MFLHLYSKPSAPACRSRLQPPRSRGLLSRHLHGAGTTKGFLWDVKAKQQAAADGCYRALQSCLRVVVGELKWGFTVPFLKEKCIWKGLNGGSFVPAMRGPAGAGLRHRELKNGAGRRRDPFEGFLSLLSPSARLEGSLPAVAGLCLGLLLLPGTLLASQ